MAINPIQFPQTNTINSALDLGPLQNLVAQIRQQQQLGSAADILGSIYGNPQATQGAGYQIPGDGGITGGADVGAPAVSPTGKNIWVAPSGKYPPLSQMLQGTQGAPNMGGTAADTAGWVPPNPLSSGVDTSRGLPPSQGWDAAGITGTPAPAPPPPPPPGVHPRVMAAIGVPALANALLSTPPERPTPQAPSMPAPGLPNAAAAYAPPAPAPEAAGQTASAEVAGDQAVAAAQPEERAKTKGEVAKLIVKELKAQGFSDNAIAGVLYNANAESSFNPTLRHPDQPRFGGEAHFAHGLFQEGGDEWNTFASDQGRRANWQDPTEQTRYVAGRLKGDIGDKYYANVNRALQNARTPEEAAKIFAVGYLKPAGPQLSGRMADINRGIPGLDAYTSSESGLPAPGSSSLGAPGERTGVQLAQAGGMGPGNYGGISREQLMALANNPLTADMAREIVMQRMTPKLIETGTNPLTGEKYFSQQIGNQLFPVQGGGGGGAGAQSLGAMYDNIARLQAQGASQQEMLQQVPSAYREGVSALIEGRALPSNMGRGAARQQLLELAHTIDPTFDESKIPVRMKLRQDFAGTGKDGQAIIAFNTAQHHINKASDDLETLAKYQGDYPSINALRAKMAQQGNRNPQLRDAIQAFNDDMQAVGKEVAHAYNSGHLGQHEMDQWNSLINSNLPPTQLRRGLADFTDLLNGKRDVLNDTYQSEFHTNAPLIEKGREENEMVTKKTHDRLEAALKGPTEPVSVRPANTAGMPHVRNKEEMDKLAPGTQFVAPDGSVWTKK